MTLGTTVVILASAGGSLAAYMASLERVLALRPARLLPAHGDPIDDPARLLTEYLDHRRHRHAQVLAALRSGVPSVEGIVARVYEGLAPALVPMARESVLAHLIALEEEGAATRADGAWRPTDG